MRTRWIDFGEIELEGKRFDHDVLVDAGHISKRKKAASKPLRAQFGHTPLTASEPIPWGGKRLIIGTGAYGRMPVAPEVLAEARRRGIKVLAMPTERALRALSEISAEEAFAVLHVTC
jgi:hypothetical protein